MRLTINTALTVDNVDNVDLTDITTATRTGPARWVDATTLDVPLDRDLTPSEATLLIRRITARNPTEETRAAAIDDAVAELDTLAGGTGSLTAAQLTTIVRRHARILAALIRYVRRL